MTAHTSIQHPSPALRWIDVGDLEAIAMGAAFLGTGGGGDPYIGRLLAQAAIGQYQPVPVIQPMDLSDGDFTVVAAGMGTPSVMIEKLANLAELDRAVTAVEHQVGRRATAIMPAEMGGLNSLLPLALAAKRGLPVIDGDGMGRAFPELQMVTFNVHGHGASPMALASESGERVLIEASNSARAELLARQLIVTLGGQCMIAAYPMNGAAARESAVPGTLSLAYAIGSAILRGRQSGDPFGELFACLARSPYYQHHALLGEGRVVDVQRRIEAGWTVGVCVIESLSGKVLEVVYRNEHLLARRNGITLTIVPDLIAVLDAETAEPITTDGLRYGQRVKVVATSAAACMRTPEALAVFGPQAFGLDQPFVPLEERLLDLLGEE